MTTAVWKLIFIYIFSSYKHTDERSCFAKNPDHLVSRIFINSRNVEPAVKSPALFLISKLQHSLSSLLRILKKLLSSNSTEPKIHCELSSNCIFSHRIKF
jgi:hypothetical protein